MKNAWILGFLLLLSCAWAQQFSVGGGLSFNAGSGGSSAQGNVQFTVRNLVQASPLTVHLRAVADAALSNSFAATISAGPLASLNLDPLQIYAGPSLGLLFSSGGVTGPIFALAAGLELPTGNVYTFLEGVFTFNGPNAGFGLRGGVNVRL
ncbi:hypothetical protein [Meiothermus hypogaeus]|uniref:Lipoprotein n=2 Tax=Meiothermus hypogaeus TaxID=884155 RepID=A0A511QZ05_9DEIN|nr:hypothetical protein [Meiothermus hypogaeus]RIH77913.1 hypothetical protein Mhypo_01828 [Meiothermus hypogaeus]GEM82609.1 hypothetical protein MHY01S_07750 [Meiothermus hypogaeus NBRC 106114]